MILIIGTMMTENGGEIEGIGAIVAIGAIAETLTEEIGIEIVGDSEMTSGTMMNTPPWKEHIQQAQRKSPPIDAPLGAHQRER